MPRRVAVLLHNVRSAHNVGAIFRTAEAAGAERMFLTGYTPAPTDRFGRARADIAKSALGAESFLPWTAARNPQIVIRDMRAGGWDIVGVEQDPKSKPHSSYRVRRPTLFVFGNEVLGLSRPLRGACDVLLEIPMRGRKESLNVSVAAGVVLFGVQ